MSYTYDDWLRDLSKGYIEWKKKFNVGGYAEWKANIEAGIETGVNIYSDDPLDKLHAEHHRQLNMTIFILESQGKLGD